MSGKRKGGGQPSDFKHRKAKVGKRALKPANLTDTSFKAASLHVAGQTVERDADGSVLVSSRGRTLGELINQLGHPASAVRHSAMKGIENVASHQSTIILRPHLSRLLDSCAKSWVDDADDVRNTGLSLFENLIPRFEKQTIAPFAPLLAAYINSALHSLDSDMRVDGSRAINILSKCHPSLVEPFLDKFIAAYARLLSERKVVKTSEGILKGLVSLLRCSNKSSRNSGNINSHSLGLSDADFTYFKGRRSRNALSLTSNKQKRTDDLMLFQTVTDMHNSGESLCSPEDQDGGSTTGHTKNLLVQIRDSIVEVIQESESNLPSNTSGGRKKEATDDNRIFLLVEAVRLVWKTCKIDIDSPAGDDEEETGTKKKDNIISVSEQIISILLEWLPDQSTTFDDDDDDKRVLVISICDTVLEVSSSLYSRSSDKKASKKKEWIRPVHRYLIARANETARNETIDVLCRLVLFLDKTGQYTELLLSALEKLQRLFFDEPSHELARTEPARKVSLLMEAIIRQHQYELEKAEGPLNAILLRIAACFPIYLQAWAADYCYESEAVLISLTEMTRRSPSYSTSELLSSFRTNLCKFVLSSSSESTKAKSRPVFEIVPTKLQRLYLGLLVLLRSPSSEILKGLAAVCSHSVHSPGRMSANIRHEIVESVHEIRKSIKMKDYLGFLVSSIGVPDKGRKNKRAKQGGTLRLDLKSLDFLDSGLKDFALCLLRCGPSNRTFQMLLPQFLNWLKPCSDVWDSMLRYRSSCAIMAILLHDIKNRNGGSVLLADIAPNVIGPLSDTCCQVIVTCSASEIDTTQIMTPYIILLRLQPELLPPVFANLEKSSNDDFPSGSWTDKIQTFSELLEDPNMKDADAIRTLLGLIANR